MSLSIKSKAVYEVARPYDINTAPHSLEPFSGDLVDKGFSNLANKVLEANSFDSDRNRAEGTYHDSIRNQTRSYLYNFFSYFKDSLGFASAHWGRFVKDCNKQQFIDFLNANLVELELLDILKTKELPEYLVSYRDLLQSNSKEEFISGLVAKFDAIEASAQEIGQKIQNKQLHSVYRLVDSIAAHVFGMMDGYGPDLLGSMGGKFGQDECLSDPGNRIRIFEIMKKSGIISTVLDNLGDFRYDPIKSTLDFIETHPDSRSLVLGCGQFSLGDIVDYGRPEGAPFNCCSCNINHEKDITINADPTTAPNVIAKVDENLMKALPKSRFETITIEFGYLEQEKNKFISLLKDALEPGGRLKVFEDIFYTKE